MIGQVEDGAMATLWSCPNSDCPPTEIAPADVLNPANRPTLSPNVASQPMTLRRCSVFPLTLSSGLDVSGPLT